MGRMTSIETKEIGKENINILFESYFHSKVKTYKDRYKLFIMSSVSCSAERNKCLFPFLR